MMTNAWALERLARDRQLEIRRIVGAPQVRRRPRVWWRERLGWSLIGVGARLALGRGGRSRQGAHYGSVMGGHGVRSLLQP